MPLLVPAEMGTDPDLGLEEELPDTDLICTLPTTR